MAGKGSSSSKRHRRSHAPRPHAPARSEVPAGDASSARSTESGRKAKNAARGFRAVLRNNGLSIALLSCFLVFLAAQSVAGHRYHNEEQLEHGAEPIGYATYLGSSHFLSATMENWESEFLQMFAYVLMTVFLFQKGSSESKDPEKDHEEVDRDPRLAKNKAGAPAPVRRGGILLKLYENSLAIAFLVLFVVSFGLHFGASFLEAREERLEHGGTPPSLVEYATDSRFWFESFQNWQSEFLAIASMVLLSIFLRQRGSPESKPVDAPHSETGE
jgi:hypothetical protein